MLRGLSKEGLEYNLTELFAKGAIPGVVTIGRSNNNTLPITLDQPENESQSLMCSRHHARLEVKEGQLQVRDEKTMNGTYVNGQRLPAEQWKVLHDGDVLTLGGTQQVWNEKAAKYNPNPWSFKIINVAEFLASYVPPNRDGPGLHFPSVEQQDQQKLAVAQGVQQQRYKFSKTRKAEGAGLEQALENPGLLRVVFDTPPESQQQPSSRDAPQQQQGANQPVKSPPKPALAAPAADQDVIDLTLDSDDDAPKRKPAPNRENSDAGPSKRPKSDPDGGGGNDGGGNDEGVASLHREFTCAICQDVIVCCHSLVPCGHNYCGECIAGYFGTGKKECPTCRQKCTAPPIRQNAIDNAIEIFASKLPPDEKEARKEKKESWEAGKKDLELQMKRPWSGRGGGNNAGNSGGRGRRFVPNHMMMGNPMSMAMVMGNPMSMAMGGMQDPVAAAAALAAAAQNRAELERWMQREVGGQRSRPSVSEYRVKYMDAAQPVPCPGCSVASLANELRIGMRNQPTNATMQQERNNPYQWYHVQCFPQNRWADACQRGVKHLRSLTATDQAAIREKLRIR